MNRHELKAAVAAHSDLERAERNYETMLPFQIGKIGIERTEHPESGIIDLAPGMLGTGTLNSVGFPSGLAEALTKTMHEYFRSEIETARGKLAALGVNIAA